MSDPWLLFTDYSHSSHLAADGMTCQTKPFGDTPALMLPGAADAAELHWLKACVKLLGDLDGFQSKRALELAQK